jgi:hypothetical protein
VFAVLPSTAAGAIGSTHALCAKDGAADANNNATAMPNLPNMMPNSPFDALPQSNADQSTSDTAE